MAIEATTRNHELETLRIERPQEQPRCKRSRLISIAMVMVLATVLGAAGNVIYAKTIGQPPTAPTMMIVGTTAGSSRALLHAPDLISPPPNNPPPHPQPLTP